MITAIDSSVAIDIFTADATFGASSREALRQCISQGAVIACDVVWAEVAASFPASSEGVSAMERLGVVYSTTNAASAVVAGDMWRVYKRRGGSRSRVVPDFLVGAHAWLQAERLLTRDRGFYRAYFSELDLLDPGRG